MVTRDVGLAPITFIGAVKPSQQRVHIAAHACGKNRPEQGLTLCSDASVIVRNWRAPLLFGQKTALVGLKGLVDGEFIRVLESTSASDTADLIEIGFARPHILYLDGLEVTCVEPNRKQVHQPA